MIVKIRYIIHSSLELTVKLLRLAKFNELAEIIMLWNHGCEWDKLPTKLTDNQLEHIGDILNLSLAEYDLEIGGEPFIK